MVSETKPLMTPEGAAEAQRAQQTRDLLNQVDELKGGEEPEIIFKEFSPRRRKVTIYSMRDGEPLRINMSLLQSTLAKRDRETGQYMFTAYKDQAPEYKLGELKCFLHPDAAERVLLDEIGLAGKTCNAAHLANKFSKRQHGLHRHKSEWGMYMEYLEDQKEEENNSRQQQQLEATLAIAKAAGKTGKD